MHPILRNILAVLTGFVAGSVVNMSLIMVSSSIIAPPPGADFTTSEGLKASMHLMEPRHFIFPFLAHALGTLIGAFVTAKIAVHFKMRLAYSIGMLFLIGGVVNVFMLPSPLWFTLTDLLLAYIPMAYTGGKMAIKKQS